MFSRNEALEYLALVGLQRDEDIDLAETALVLGSIEGPKRPLAPYRAHLATLIRDAQSQFDADADDLGARIATLNAVIVDRHGYRGDRETYDDLRNANLMHVIDRKRGLPVTLGILYLHVARAMEWSMVGLNFPGHFLIRADYEGERVILDPFNEGRVCSAVDLRDMLKAVMGTVAELEPSHYQPVGNRDTLLRLQNNLKLRHINSDDLALALEELETMLLFAPNEAGLWRESGLIEAHIGNVPAAIHALQQFVRLTKDIRHAQQTEQLIRQLKARLTSR